MHIHIDRIFTTVSRNLGIEDYTSYIQSWIEWSYEAEKLIGSKETFVQKEVTYTSSGAQATGSIEFTDVPSSGDSINLNGVDFFFKTGDNIGKADGPEEFLIAQNMVETLTTTLPEANSNYGVLENLKGFRFHTTSPPTARILTSPKFVFPELIDVATYGVDIDLGDDMVTDGDFASATNWNTGTNWSITGAAAVHSTGASGYLRQDITFEEGSTYMIQFDISSWTAGTLLLGNHVPEGDGVSGSSTDDNLSITAGQTSGTTITRYWKQGPSSLTILNLLGDTTFDGTIDNIVVKKVNKVTLNITSKEIGYFGNDYKLGSDNQNAKISGLNLTGGKEIYRNQQLVLPEDNLKLLAVRVGKDDSTYENSELRKTSAVHRERVGWNNDNTQQRSFRYYVDGNRVNIQHDDFDEITIVYLAFPTDMRGWPMIKEGHETAVAQYIMWQMKLIEFYNGKLPQYITKELEKRWYFLCGKARGDDSMPTSEELSQIGKMWNTLIPVKSGRGLIDF